MDNIWIIYIHSYVYLQWDETGSIPNHSANDMVHWCPLNGPNFDWILALFWDLIWIHVIFMGLQKAVFWRSVWLWGTISRTVWSLIAFFVFKSSGIVLHSHHSYTVNRSFWFPASVSKVPGGCLCRIPMDVWLQVGSRLELQSELPNYIDGLSLPIIILLFDSSHPNVSVNVWRSNS